MATIKTSLQLFDGITGPIHNMNRAMQILINTFENVQDISSNAVNTANLQEARELAARSAAAFDNIEQQIRESDHQQQKFNNDLRAASPAADALGSKLKGILATVVSIAGIRGALGWVKENLELADTQRNAENQLKAVMANMGVEPIEVPVSIDATAAAKQADSLSDTLKNLNNLDLENSVIVNVAPAIQAISKYKKAASALDGAEMESTLALDTAPALDDYSAMVSVVSEPITIDLQADATQTISAFDAIKAKAAEIQSKGIYGDEAMIAGAAEFATYFTDAEAIMSMMDTLSNYAMGMTGGGAIDATAMVDYATGLGKIMTGSYEAMTKKGFEFTDAQKAIIEGTATEAQIVEVLGEEYLNASADMQAAAAINSVIAESWDGLYESMSNTPEGKIISLKNRFGDLREELGNRLYNNVLSVGDAFESRWGQVETMMFGLADAAGVLLAIIATLAGYAMDVGQAFQDNWSWIEPIVWGLVTALTAYAVISGVVAAVNAITATSEGVKAAAQMMATGATFAETAAQYGLNAALMACPVFWIVAGIIALVAAIVAAIRATNTFGSKGTTVLGTIAGLVNVVIQTFVNLGLLVADIAVGMWNALGAACSNIGTAFHNVIANVQGWFYGLLSTVMNVVSGIAAALNSLPFVSFDYSGIVAKADEYAAKSAEAYGSVEEYTSISDAFKEGFGTFDAFQSGWAQDAFDAGAAWGDNLSGNISDGLDSLLNIKGVDAFDMGTGLDALYGNVGGIGANTGETAANTAAMRDALDYMEEDLAWMIDIAEREAINRFTTAEITLNQENTNYVDKDTDLDGVMDAWAADFAERLDISAEGI